MNRRDVLRRRFAGLVSLLLWAGLTVSSDGQSPRDVSSATRGAAAGSLHRARIDQAYELAGRASNVEQLSQALQLCGELKQPGLLPVEDRYLEQLTAWLLNRRGELLAQQANQLRSRGEESQSTGLEQRALQDFAGSIQLDPQWRAYHNRGVSYALLGRVSEALEDFGQAVRRNPQQTGSHFNRAELLLDLGRSQEADQEYTAVLERDPADAAARLGRAHARFYQRRFAEALRDFDELIRQQPENAVAYADRADLYAFLGQWEPAARDYVMAIHFDKSLGRAYQSAAWLMATCPDAHFRDSAMALQAAQRAIELDGYRDYRYLDTLAAAQANADQFPAAQESLQQALQTAPPDAVPELRQRLALYQQREPYRDAAR